MKKRITSLLLVAAMIMSMIIIPAGATDNATMTVGTVTGSPGEYVDVDLTFSGLAAANIDATIIEFSVGYDSRYLEVIPETASGYNFSATPGEAWATTMFSAGHDDTEVLVGTMAMAPLPKVDGVMATIRFLIKDSAP